MDRTSVRLTRREMLDVSGMGLTQLRIHLERLVALEHVLVHAGSRGHSFVYELLFDGHGKSGAPHLSGLIDIEKLQSIGTNSGWRGDGGSMAGSKRAHGGGPPATSVLDDKDGEIRAHGGEIAKRATGASAETASYLHDASNTQMTADDVEGDT